MHFGTCVIALLLTFTTLVLAGPAWAATACTSITTLPATITTPGVHCLNQDLNTSITTGNAIEIQADNVVIDLNGFKLGGLAAGPGTDAIGIFAGDRRNITVRNGTVRGFFFGILLEDSGASSGHLVESIRADHNTGYGIYVEGTGVVVRRNVVASTGGTTVFSPDADAFGIAVFGAGPRVLDNDVSNTFAQGAGVATAIWIRDSTGGLAVRNRITTAGVGIDYDLSDGKYRGNLMFDIATPFQGGGTDAGGNN